MGLIQGVDVVVGRFGLSRRPGQLVTRGAELVPEGMELEGVLLARLGEQVRVRAAHCVELLLERDAAVLVAAYPIEQLLRLADRRPQLLREHRLGALRAGALLGGSSLGALTRLALRSKLRAEILRLERPRWSG